MTFLSSLPLSDDIFNKSWTWKGQLPKHFLQKCQDLIRMTNPLRLSEECLSSLLSEAVKLLVKSCRANIHDLDIIAAKILHISQLFFQRYGKIISEHGDLVSYSHLVLLGSEHSVFTTFECLNVSNLIYAFPM